jgi:hypothetical protein
MDCIENDEQVEIDAPADSVDSRFHDAIPCADP